ncbi:hypothetical protein QN362_18260 [Actimicrobium sp. CCC2.4]|uniref:hypothetical protein n=1 Tax=Actimicrobium sp. CCC2.4 TaxID=3048606 RepID=UPI002AC8DF26|nr:hypothetical protein [Actimicrobium sp. CCC2.4]MEB0137279.1 hypothetical protein [Actimicrobium sp. CCC2.4]WPX32539.1 hypothetical protein RHM62_01425 [Actimicrobium sp. CCC2.4]
MTQGTRPDAVSALVDTALHQFVTDNRPYLPSNPSVQMSYETPRYMRGTLGNSRAGSGLVRLSVETIARQARYISSGNADAALKLIAYHEFTHALGSKTFAASASRIGAKMVRADDYLGRSNYPQRNDVLIEALTAALENVPGISGNLYRDQVTGLVLDRHQRPVSWRRFGLHLLEHLGEVSIKKALFNNEATAVRALEAYIDDLIRQYPRKVLSSDAPSDVAH